MATAYQGSSNVALVHPVADVTAGTISFVGGKAVFYTRDVPAGELGEPVIANHILRVEKTNDTDAYVQGGDVNINVATQLADAGGTRAGWCAQDSPAGETHVLFRINE